MKISISSNSSSKTPLPASSTASGRARHRPEGRGDNSYYFPGCRKDTNCTCEMCLASINATLDLVPTGSSITKLSALSSAPKKAAASPPLTGVEPETPPATSSHIPTTTFCLTPPMESTAKSRPPTRAIPSKNERSWGLGLWKTMLLLGFLWFLFETKGFGLLNSVMEGFRPRLSEEILMQFGEESRSQSADLRGRLRILELKIKAVDGGGVFNCSSSDSIWEMKQPGRLLYWRCVIYESMAEEVSVWGSPLKTSGLISNGFSSPSLTLLCGRITEWSDGKLVAISRTGNLSSWNLQRWMSVAVLLESNTWVLEYKRSALVEGSRWIPTALEMLKMKSLQMFKVVKKEPWSLLTLGSMAEAFYYHPEEDHVFMPPT